MKFKSLNEKDQRDDVPNESILDLTKMKMMREIALHLDRTA
ncbi:hypothetical protein [Bacillus sp. FJAT-29790]|nr:hypothetical protein [Bacillus sp. FJAT-29790]